jgi:hypothetical protein
MLRARKPEPLIALGAWTEAGWIALERCSIQCALERRAGELVTRGTPSFIPGDSPAIANWREFTVPWIRNDIHDSIRSMTEAEAGFMFGSIPPGAFARFHGSPC